LRSPALASSFAGCAASPNCGSVAASTGGPAAQGTAPCSPSRRGGRGGCLAGSAWSPGRPHTRLSTCWEQTLLGCGTAPHGSHEDNCCWCASRRDRSWGDSWTRWSWRSSASPVAARGVMKGACCSGFPLRRGQGPPPLQQSTPSCQSTCGWHSSIAQASQRTLCFRPTGRTPCVCRRIRWKPGASSCVSGKASRGWYRMLCCHRCACRLPTHYARVSLPSCLPALTGGLSRPAQELGYRTRQPATAPISPLPNPLSFQLILSAPLRP